ncbi:XyeB family radical SAM/SPASM peptide maturase [soil metagenome]
MKISQALAQSSSKKLSLHQTFAVVKIAEVCNLKCPYCYFFFGGDNSYKDDPAVMTPETARNVAKFLAQGAVDLGLKRIDISLHGGEPLMVGKRRFEEICTALREIISPECELAINMQTNGVLVDEEWVDIFRRHSIGIGVSIDGDQATHDRNRFDRKGRGSYEKTIAGIRMIERYSPVGILCVIQPASDGAAIYRHFVHDLGFTSIDFLLPLQNWDNFNGDMTDAVTRFYIGVLDAWLADNRPNVRIRTLSDPLIAMLSDEGARRRAYGLLDNTDAITIRSNGDVCPDDTLTSIRPALRRTGYNVRSSLLADFMSDPLWNDLRPNALKPAGKCVGCEWWGICRGGHADHRYSTEHGFRGHSTYCTTYEALYARLKQYVSRAIPAEVLRARLTKLADLQLDLEEA